MTPIFLAVMPLKRFPDFSGRSRRAEYWWFYLLCIIVLIAAATVDQVFGMTDNFSRYGPVSIISLMIVLVPSLAVSIRRLHDQDMTGWFLLLGAVPVVGGIALIWLFTRPGTAGGNRYGPDPLADPASTATY